MSEAVDTRVVEAKFDSKEFEKGVDRTVKKLDELKSSLNLKDSGKTISELADKTKDASEKASKSLEKLQDRFTSFTGMLKQKLLSGIADEIVGVFFKIKNGFNSMVRSLSSAQISAGMQRYNDILTSVRTLVSAGVNQEAAYESIERLGQYADQTSYSLDELVSTMSKFKTAGADLKTAQRMIEGLSNAAASMGVNAQQASRAYLNLQQAYSKGAMLQNDWISFESLPMVGTKFNQAIIDAAVAIGTLEEEKAKIDKETGQKIVSYKTKSKKGSQVKTSGADAKGITAENMGTKLSSRWFNKEVMEEVFAGTYYFSDVAPEQVNKIKDIERSLKKQIESGALKQEDYDKTFQGQLDKITAERRKLKQEELDKDLEAEKITKKEYDKLLKEFDKENHLTTFSWDAFRAGQEARSLTDVLNTLKDTISRGWATSFEYIFGKLDEAADFFTKLTESNFANAIYAIGDFRNAVLEQWSKSNGRENLIESLETIDDLLGSIFEKIGLIRKDDWFDRNFDQDTYDNILKNGGYDAAERYKQSIQDMASEDPFTEAAQALGDRLAMLSRNIGLYVEKIRKWFTEVLDDGETRLDKISKLLSSIGTIVNGITYAATTGIQKAIEILNALEPIFTSIWNAVNKLLEPITALFNPDEKDDSGLNVYDRFSDILENIRKVAEKVAKPLSVVLDVLADVGKFFLELSVGTIATNMQFFGDIFGMLMEILFGDSAQIDRDNKKIEEHRKQLDEQLKQGKITKKEYDELLADDEKYRGVLGGLAKGIADLGQACKDAFQFVVDFFNSVIADVKKLLGLTDENGEMKDIKLFENIGNFFKDNAFIKSVKEWIDNACDDIIHWVTHIPERLSKYAISVGDLIRGLFYEKTTVKETKIARDPVGNVIRVYKEDVEVEVETQLLQSIKNIKDNITKFITETIPSFFTDGIPNFFETIFHSLLYEKKQDKVRDQNGNILQVYDYEIETPLKKWLDQAIADVKTWIAGIPEKIASIPSIIGEFFHGLFWQKVPGKDKGQETEVPTALNAWVTNAVEDVKKWIKQIPNKIKKVPSLLKEFIHNLLYTKKTNIAKDKNGNIIRVWTTETRNSLGDILKGMLDSVKEFVKDIPNMIKSAINFTGDFIASIAEAIFGKKEDVENELKKPFEGISVQGIFDSIKDIGKTILNQLMRIFTGSDDWQFNTEWFKNKVNSAWEAIKGFIINLPENVANLFKGKEAADGDDSTVGSAILGFAGKVGEFLSEIPGALLGAWNIAKSELGNIWNTIVSGITGGTKGEVELTEEQQKAYDRLAKKNPDLDLSKLVQVYWEKNNPIIANIRNFFVDLGDTIKGDFEVIKTKIEEAWPTVEEWIKDIPNKISKFFDDVKNPEQAAEGSAGAVVRRIAEAIGNELSKIPSLALNVFKTAKEGIDSLWNTIITSVTGGTKGAVELTEEQQKAYDRLAKKNPDLDLSKLVQVYWEKNNPIMANIRNFFVELKDYIIEQISNLPQNIAEGLSIGASLLNGLFETVTGWFKDENAKKVIENSGEMTTEEIAESFKKGTEDQNGNQSPFLKALSDFGSTVAAFITKTLPGFIREGFIFVKTNVSEWIDALTGLFMGGEPKVGEEAKSFGEIIIEKIKSIPEMIMSAVEWVKSLFGGNKKDSPGKILSSVVMDAFMPDQDEIDKLNEEDPTGYAAQQYIDSFKKRQVEYERLLAQDPTGYAAEMYKRDLEKPIISFIENLPDEFNIWEEIKKIGKAIGDAFVEIGPNIVDGIKRAFEWIGKNLTIATEKINSLHNEGKTLFDIVFGEDSGKDAEGNELPLWKSIKEIGKTIYTFITQTVPNFIVAAATDIWNSLPKLLSGIFGGGEEVPVDKVVENAEKTTEQIAKALNPFSQTAYDQIFQHEGKAAAERYKKSCQWILDAQDETFIEFKETAENLTKGAEEGSDLWSKILSVLNPISTAEAEGVDYEEDKKQTKGFVESATDMIGSFGGLIDTLGSTLSGNTGKTIAIIMALTLLISKIAEMFSIADVMNEIKGIVWGVVFAGIVAILGYVTYLASFDPEKFKTVEKIMNCLEVLINGAAVIVALWKGADFAGSLVDLIRGRKNDPKAIVSAESAVENIGTKFFGFLETLSDTFLTPIKIGGTMDAITAGLEEILGTLTSGINSIAQSIDSFLEFLQPSINKLVEMEPILTTAGNAIPRIGNVIKEFYTLMTSNTWTELLEETEKEKGSTDSAGVPEISRINEKTKLIYTMTIILTEIGHALDGLNKVDDPTKKLEEATKFVKSESFKDFYLALVTTIYEIQESLNLLYGGVFTDISQIGETTRHMADVISIFAASVNGIDKDSVAALQSVFELMSSFAEGVSSGAVVGHEKGAILKMIVGDTSLSAFGRVLSSFTTSMITVFRSLKIIKNTIADTDGLIDTSEYQNFMDTINLVTEFGKQMMTVAGTLETLFGVKAGETKALNGDAFTVVTEKLPIIAQTIVESLGAMNNFEGMHDFDFENIFKCFEAINMIKDAIDKATTYYENAPEKLNYLANALVGEDGTGGFLQRLKDAGVGWDRSAYGGISEFIDMIHDLSETIQFFYETDQETGDPKYLEGLKNMFDMEWATFIGDPNWQSPTITPVLEISDDFKAKAQELRNLIGFDPTIEAGNNINNQITFSPNWDFLNDFKPINYNDKLDTVIRRIESVKASTDSLADALSGIGISIDGNEVAETILPYIDKGIGMREAIEYRLNLIE